MPGENIAAGAASQWTGAEALAFGVAFAALVALGGVVIYHLRDCGAARRRLEARLDRISQKVTELKVEVGHLRDLLMPRKD